MIDKLQSTSGEPWGADGTPSTVLVLPEPFFFPMCVGLTQDRQQMVLVDSVDHYQVSTLDKAQATQLAEYFRELADQMF